MNRRDLCAAFVIGQIDCLDMSSRIIRGELPVDSPSFGQAFVYVVPCSGEDILKVGFSRDPLIRLQTLHPRYFEFFDIDAAFLIETDLVREARAIEALFASELHPHSAPEPLSVRHGAGGQTEWYRGASSSLRAMAESLCRSHGRELQPLRPWLRSRLLRQSENFFEWSMQIRDALDISRAQGLDGMNLRLQSVLRDTLDAFSAFDVPVAQSGRPEETTGESHATRIDEK